MAKRVVFPVFLAVICLTLALAGPVLAESGEPTPNPVGLVNGQTTDVVLEADCNYDFYLDVPEGATELTVNLVMDDGEDGATAILYTRFGEQVTQELYDCISDTGGVTESCGFIDPAAGRWYIRATTILAGTAKLTATYYDEGGSGALPLFDGEQKALVLAEGSSDLFFIDVPEGATELTTELNVASGQARLYARAGQIPTEEEYDWASDPVGPGQEATVSKKPTPDDDDGDDGDDGDDDVDVPENQAKYELTDPAAGRYYFLVAGLGEGEASIEADYSLSDGDDGNGGGNAGDLTNNRWTTINVAAGEEALFAMEVPAGSTQFKVDMKTRSGEASLFTSYNEPPTLASYDCSSYGQHGTVKCIHHFPKAGTWYILIYGDSAAQVEVKPLVTGD